MRKALIALLAVGVAACSTPQPAYEQVMVGRVFPQVSTFILTEPVNLSETLHAFAGGPDIDGRVQANEWLTYMAPVGKQRKELSELPLPIEVMAVESPSEVPCDQAVVRNNGFGRPFICRESDEVDKGPNRTVQDYVMVMHTRVSQMVIDVTARSGAKAGWQAATMATALVYSEYLQQQYGPHIGWPSTTTMAYCVAGISTRAVFAPNELSQQDVANAMTATDGLLGMVAERGSRFQAFMKGFTDGRLDNCAALAPNVSTSVSFV